MELLAPVLVVKWGLSYEGFMLTEGCKFWEQNTYFCGSKSLLKWDKAAQHVKKIDFL